MNIRKIFATCCALFALAASASAQQQEENTSTLWNNWYIEANAGAQALFSTDASRLLPKDRISSYFALTGGKWITESFGFRLRVEGYAGRAYSEAYGLFLDDPVSFNVWGNNDPRRQHVEIMPDGSYRRNIRYINSHADVQVSLFNLFDLRPKDRWDMILSAGLGYYRLIAFKGNSGLNSVSTNFGIMAKYRLNRNIDINLEAGTAIMPDQFDGRVTGKMFENTLAVSAGITYKFNRRGFKKHRVPVEVIKEVEKIIRDTVYTVKEVVVEKEKPEKQFILATITFKIDQHNPVSGQQTAFENIVKYAESHPDAIIRLDGYADAETGTPDYNLQLSTKRAATVRSILINKYNIEQSRIQAQGIGMNAQPYSENKFNRAVVATIIEKQ